MPKVAFSRTLEKASWSNTKRMGGNMATESLIDEYQVVLIPVVLGQDRTTFDGIREKLAMRLTQMRTLGSGKVYLCYEPVA